MSNGSATIVQRLWNYCNILRDDGSLLRRLRRAAYLFCCSSRWRTSANKPSPNKAPDHSRRTTTGPVCCRSKATLSKSITATSSKRSASESGMLGVIFRKAQNKIQDPAKLRA